MIRKVYSAADVKSAKENAEDFLKVIDEMIVDAAKDALDVTTLNSVGNATDTEMKYARQAFKIYKTTKDYILQQAKVEDEMMDLLTEMRSIIGGIRSDINDIKDIQEKDALKKKRSATKEESQ